MHAWSVDVSSRSTSGASGEAGRRLSRYNWSNTPLGHPARWPATLKTAIDLLLGSTAQVCLFWGPELVAIYNDAFAPAIGENHPRAFGQPGRIGWAAIWDVLEPLLRAVQQTGTPFGSEAHLFLQQRYGFEEETYFDVSYAPVHGAGGSVDGIFCIVSDQTRRVIDERRLRTLRALSMLPAADHAADAAFRFITALAEEDRSDAPYALVYLRDPEARLVLAAHYGGEPVVTVVDANAGAKADAKAGAEAGSNGARDPRCAALLRVAATGVTEAVDGRDFVRNAPDTASDRLVLLPLHTSHGVEGVLVVAKNRRLQPTPDYRRFSELLASQLSAGLSSARLLTRERERSRDLEQQVTAALAERQVAENQLRQSQKMEAIGKLTSGVAHDFNNLLQVVDGNLHLLRGDVSGQLQAEQRVQNALAGVARGARLSAQLLAFSRRQPLEPKGVHVGRLIRGLDDMLRRSLGEAIEIRTAIDPALWNALIDPAQLENVLLNLAINARDAMEGRGQLLIEASNLTLAARTADDHGELVAGDYVVVAVTDTGSGMTPEVLEQAFEPFFSTKPEGKGTGLGLSMVYGFVRQSGGHIQISSTPGEGTIVRLTLPRMMEETLELPEPQPGPVVGGSETILVAEDNEGVRDTVASMLVELGYRVLKAKDAASALTVLESGVAVDLLFTDVVMPGAMLGPELARAARAANPRLAVLFTSGYADDALTQGGQLDAGVELFSKPYTGEALARKLRQVLGPRAAMPGPVLAAAAPAAPNPAARHPPQQAPLSLLLVEDDAVIRENSAEMLTSHAFGVDSTATGEAAMQRLLGNRFDVLVTDLGLPGIDGVELARLAVAHQPDLGIVFATGADMDGGERVGPLARAVILPKPYDEQALIRAITTADRNRPASEAVASEAVANEASTNEPGR